MVIYKFKWLALFFAFWQYYFSAELRLKSVTICQFSYIFSHNRLDDSAQAQFLMTAFFVSF